MTHPLRELVGSGQTLAPLFETAVRNWSDEECRRLKNYVLAVPTAIESLLDEVEGLRAALKPFAEKPTITEIMAPDWKDPWIDATVERRIEMIGERTRNNDAETAARLALSSDAGER